ncbi:hypothetical protein JCM8547_006912 [Rhodosporidiobolus lusitaniae]
MSRPLPLELVQHILGRLDDDKRTLARCCRVSRPSLEMARPLLYARLTFGYKTNFADESEVDEDVHFWDISNLAILITLSRHPHLRPLVKSFRIEQDYGTASFVAVKPLTMMESVLEACPETTSVGVVPWEEKYIAELIRLARLNEQRILTGIEFRHFENLSPQGMEMWECLAITQNELTHLVFGAAATKSKAAVEKAFFDLLITSSLPTLRTLRMPFVSHIVPDFWAYVGLMHLELTVDLGIYGEHGQPIDIFLSAVKSAQSLSDFASMQPYRPPPTPPPHLRRPSSTSSSSFLSSTTSFSEDTSDESSSDDSDDSSETEGYASSSGVSGDESRFIRRLDVSLQNGAGGANGPGGTSRFPSGTAGATATTSLGGSTSARSNLKLSLAVLRARQSLASQSYEALAGALKSLSAALPPVSSLALPANGGDNPLGVFVPILHRLAKDVMASVAGEEKGREFRKKLGKEDAKALVALKQRWSGGGKGKGKEQDADWVAGVDELVSKNPPPAFLSDPNYASLTPSLLTSVEALLLPSSLPRLSLSRLELQDHDLEAWPVLCRLPEVLVWLVSFITPIAAEAERRARRALDGVKSLDLSKNALTSFPIYLTRLFPHLETLSLSHNQFAHLPAWITLFSSLRRIRTHGNLLVTSRRALKPLSERISRKKRSRPRGTQANVRDVLPFLRDVLLEMDLGDLLPSSPSNTPPSLTSISTQLSQSVFATEETLIPPHLEHLLLESYHCTSCRRYILATSPLHLPAFFERIHHLDPGVSLPSHIPSSPSPARPPPSSPFSAPSSQRLVSTDQRILLALLSRLDSRPPRPPPRRTSSTASLSSLASTSTTSNGPPRRRPTRRERDWENGKAVLPTLVVGGEGEHGREYRFCVVCAAAHLGMEQELEDTGVEWACWCFVCVEERRVKGETAADLPKEADEKDTRAKENGGEGTVEASKAKVLRWLRRKERMGKEVVPLGAMRIV